MPIYQQMMTWRKVRNAEAILTDSLAKTWLDFEVQMRKEARRKDLSPKCQYHRSEDVHTIEDNFGKRSKLNVEPCESFYMTKKEFEEDLVYLNQIYDEVKPTEELIIHYWKWGKHLWVRGIQKGESKRGLVIDYKPAS